MSVLYVDSFAGGGGASTGIELATGHPVDIAINHDQSAIMMHKQNHPYTEHFLEDIWQVDPIEVTKGQKVRFAWFSPDCKHFSRAKGAALVDRHIRGLAWVVLRWAGTVRPDVIMLENVPEFVTWGPVRKGKPVKSKSGQTYQKWYRQLADLGYKIETKELCAADYGAPTIRKRFYLIARCDGQPIIWPDRTHAPIDSVDVKSGKCLPWRSAAEIIDWTQPCYSIFESKEEIKEKYGVRVVRPLKENTLRRIARGLDKFVIKSAEPYIVDHLSPYIMSNNSNNAPHGMETPLPTITTGNRNFVVAPSLIQYHSERSDKENRGQILTNPLNTVDAANRYGLSTVCLTEYCGNGRDGIGLHRPLQTITSKDREGITIAYLQKYFSGIVGAEMRSPLPTVTAVDHNALMVSQFTHLKGQDKSRSRTSPRMTVTARDAGYGKVITKIVKADCIDNLGYWPEIRDLLNRYCGYHLSDDEILSLTIADTSYYISDIGLRMLTPRELYNAMGFPSDYIIDHDVYGCPISRSDQVARCGNAVCPAVAEALVRANLQECIRNKFATMRDLHMAMGF